MPCVHFVIMEVNKRTGSNSFDGVLSCFMGDVSLIT